MDSFKIDIDADGIALVTFDAPGRSMNTLTSAVLDELGEVAERLKSNAAIKGAVIASGKAGGFCAGADLGELGGGLAAISPGDEAALAGVYDRVHRINRVFRAIESCGKPVAAAIEGLALGGGLELALACHHRVVADDPKIKLGLPESKVGLLPGGGGTQRLPRLVGLMAAGPLLLEGKEVRPAEAKSTGFIDQLAPVGEVVAAARAWVRTGDPVARWDRKDFKIPGGGPYHPSGMQMFVMGNAMARKATYGNYPAQANILRAVYEGLQLPIDAALRVESRYFTRTLTTPQARAMIRTLFLSMQALKKGAARPAGVARSDARKVAVLGAGMMGAGVAHAQALAGIETVLIDQSQEAAERGKAHAADLLAKAVKRGRMDQAVADAALARILPATDYAHVEGCDLVIEAVFEARDVKAEVTRKAEARLAPGAVFGSNTSTLPITGLAQASVRPADFIGVHFFSPVDKMGLVEIIVGEETGQDAVAKAIDYVLKIRKTPIVVNDSRGFYTSRCFSTFIQEGMEMLAEGIAPAIIDNVGRMSGMPRGPLEMHDDVALDLSHRIATQTASDLGDAYAPPRFAHLLETMVVELGRHGRKNGKGFYDYPAEAGGKKTLWRGLSDLQPVTVTEAEPDAVAELKTRLLARQAVEAARCFEEGVITDPRQADVGSILGWGFAPWTGGVVSYMDEMGPAKMVELLDRLAHAHGERFAPPALLRDMAAGNETFYDRFGPAPERAAA